MRHLLGGVLGLLTLATPAQAQVREDARLSDQGRTLIAGAVGGSWSNDHTPHEGPRGSAWSLDVSPSFAYFFWQRVALGAYGTYGCLRHRAHTTQPYYGLGASSMSAASGSVAKFDRLAVGVQGITELVLGRRIGLFFWVTAGYATQRLRRSERPAQFSTSSAAGATTQQRPFYGRAGRRDQLVELTLFVPLTFHVSDRLAFGLGPHLQWRGHVARGPGEARILDSLRVGGSSWIGASF